MSNYMNDEQRREALETIPAQWRQCSFSQPQVLYSRCKAPVAIARAKYQIGRLLRGEQWLVVLAGESGEGKTSLACAMLRYAIEHGTGWTCTFASAMDLVGAFRSSRRNETPSIIDECEKASILCIDDLGADCISLQAVIYQRETLRRPTIVTTFMTEQEAQVYGAGIRRLYRDGGVVWVGAMPARRPDGDAQGGREDVGVGVNIEALRDEIVALRGEREAAFDCHPADGVSFCGACLSCWARVFNQVVQERDAARAVLGEQAEQLSRLIDADDVGQSGVSKLYAVVQAMRAAAKGQR